VEPEPRPRERADDVFELRRRGRVSAGRDHSRARYPTKLGRKRISRAVGYVGSMTRNSQKRPQGTRSNFLILKEDARGLNYLVPAWS
jgi:hypothetical protein